ncbi:MAG: UvrD-helicase domain-containing protein [Polyangiaceae bacterium]
MALLELQSFGFEKNLVLAASAGTGKTFTLVGILVRVLLGRTALGAVEPHRAVATTFSRKAAAEIHARVTEELTRIEREPSTSPYRAWLVDEETSDEELGRRARAVLSNSSRMRIGTLHGFATSIVRSFPLELGLSPRLELTPEREAHARAEAAISEALEHLWLREPAHARALVDGAGSVQRLVTQLRRVLSSLDEDGRSAEDLVVGEGDADALTRRVHAFVELAGELASDPKLGDAARAFSSDWSRGDVAAIERSLSALLGIAIRTKNNPAHERLRELRERLPGDNNAERGRLLARAWARRDGFEAGARAAREILVRAEATLARASRLSGGLSFGEILRAARDLLRDHPDVAREVGDGISALLVDEFQDTSRVQKELLQLLWADPAVPRQAGVVPSLADLRGRGLLVVGDRKQSIYGFRGADVGVFAELAIGLAGAPAREALGVPQGLAWEPREPVAAFSALRHNRRGNARLLGFANAMSRARFCPGTPPQLFEIAYVGETEDLLVPPEREAEASALEPAVTWLRVVRDKGASTKLDEAFVIADRVRQILSSGSPRVGPDARAPQLRDIAVLATSNAMLDAASFALSVAGLPFVVAGRGFFRAREVRDVASMLRLLLEPSDPLAALEVLRGPWAGVHDTTLLGLTAPGRSVHLPHGGDWGPREALVQPADREAVERVTRVVADLSRAATRASPGVLLREAVRALSFDDVVARMPRGAMRAANVAKLLDMADGHADARSFLEWLDEAVEVDASETEAATFSERDDAVRLLTVHASKGLDFPIVFVPEIAASPPSGEHGAVRVDLGTSGTPARLAVRLVESDGAVLRPPSFEALLDVDRRRRQAERQRLAYVAVTRAADAMFLVGCSRSSKPDDPAVTTVGALQVVAEDANARALLAIDDVTPPSPSVVTPEAALEADGAPSADVIVAPPRWRSLAIAPTALADFAYCRRRYELVHVLRMPEHTRAAARATGGGTSGAASAGDVTLDARARGTLAHRVLERVEDSAFGVTDAHAVASRQLALEGVPDTHPQHRAIVERVTRFLTGSYARRVAEAGAAVSREVAFVLTLVDADARELVLHGSMDLVVTWPDGAVDVVDYKSARGAKGEGASAPYAFQLDVYAEAARRTFDVAAPRVGLAFLGGDPGEPVWHTPSDGAALSARLTALAAALSTARWTSDFPREPLDRCDAITCGFIGRCHASTERKPARATTT